MDIFLLFVSAFCLALASGLTGLFLNLNQRSLVADAASHATLAGIGAFYFILVLFQPLQNFSSLILLLGAFLSAFSSMMVIEYLKQKTSLTLDTIIACVLAFYFAVGSILFSAIQNLEGYDLPNRTGLMGFLMGQIATISPSDIEIIIPASLFVVLLNIGFFFHHLKHSFDKSYASSQGNSSNFFQSIMTLNTLLILVVGLKFCGLILTIALLLFPFSIARLWSHTPLLVLAFTILFSILSVFTGLYLSLNFVQLPTGSLIVLSFFALFMLSLLVRGKSHG
jgi:manganese/zinc/iron transport system permease protein